MNAKKPSAKEKAEIEAAWTVENIPHTTSKGHKVMRIVGGSIYEQALLDTGTTFIDAMKGILFTDWTAAVQAQIDVIKKKHPTASLFTIVNESHYDPVPLELSYVRKMTAHEQKVYDAWHACKEAADKKRADRRAELEKKSLKRLLAKHPDVAVNMNVEGTKTGRVSSKEKAKSNVPKMDRTSKNIMNRDK